jgi:hypothetical protein
LKNLSSSIKKFTDYQQAFLALLVGSLVALAAAAWYENPLSIDGTRRWVYETEADRGFD